MNKDVSVDKYMLRQHIKKICEHNLKSEKIRICATCPFEDIIVDELPYLKEFFIAKRSLLLKLEKDNI